MHQFGELISRSTEFVMAQLDKLQSETIDELQSSSATVHIKNLQAVNLQIAINVVGAFAIFEAHLQDQFEMQDDKQTQYAFDEARKRLKARGLNDLENQFGIFIEAIHVLKHGKGKSYEKLLGRGNLPFRIKQPDENFFEEGDVSEVQTLICVNKKFVKDCLEVVDAVSYELGIC